MNERCLNPNCDNPVSRKDHKHCSLKCAREHRKSITLSKKPIQICDTCGKEYMTWNFLIGKYKHNFCSIECKRVFDIERLHSKTGINHPRFTNNIVKCLFCNKEFHRPPSTIRNENKIFCSNDCYLAYSNTVVVCKWCGKELKVQINQANKLFCDKACYGQWLSENNCAENHPSWKGGWFPYYGKDWKRQRKLAKERDKNTCQVCKTSANEIGTKNIDVHHIIPYMESKNNSLDNLITLCDKCHHLLENDKINLLSFVSNVDSPPMLI